MIKDAMPNSTSNEISPRSERKWLWVLLGLALLLRCINLLYSFDWSGGTPVFKFDGDEIAFNTIAVNVLRGDGFHDGDWWAWRYPGYCYFLAGTYLLSGNHPLSTIIIQILLSVLTCYLFYLLIRQSFGARAALIGLALMSFYIPFIRLPGRLFTENTALPCFLGFWYLYWSIRNQPSIWKMIGAGVCLGLCTLNRESALAFALPVFLIDVFRLRKHETRLNFAAVAVVILFTTLTIAPWTLRNYLLFNKFVLVTTNGPTNFYYGAQPQATGFPPMMDMPPPYNQVKSVPDLPPGQHYRHDPERGIYQEIEYNHEQMRASLAYIRNHPSHWFSVAFKRLYYFWTLPSVTYFNVQGRVERLLELLWDLSYLIFLIPGLAGAWAFRKRFVELSIPYMLLFIPTFLSFLSAVVSRYRFPTDIALMFFASAAIALLWEKTRQKRSAA